MPTVVGKPATSFNGTTLVEALAAPAAGKQRWLDGISGLNPDSVAHVVELYIRKVALDTKIARVTAPAGAPWTLTARVALLATDESLMVALAEAVVATQPTFVVSAVETP